MGKEPGKEKAQPPPSDPLDSVVKRIKKHRRKTFKALIKKACNKRGVVDV